MEGNCWNELFQIIYLLFYSVQLARRVLKLERINVSLRQQLESQDKDKRTMEEKV